MTCFIIKLNRASVASFASRPGHLVLLLLHSWRVRSHWCEMSLVCLSLIWNHMGLLCNQSVHKSCCDGSLWRSVKQCTCALWWRTPPPLAKDLSLSPKWPRFSMCTHRISQVYCDKRRISGSERLPKTAHIQLHGDAPCLLLRDAVRVFTASRQHLSLHDWCECVPPQTIRCSNLVLRRHVKFFQV